MSEKHQLSEKRKEELPARIRNAEDTALINKYRKKKSNIPAQIKIEKKTENRIKVKQCEDDTELLQAKMVQAFGTSSEELQQYFIIQIINAFNNGSSDPDEKELTKACNMTIAMLHELEPRDAIEVMLITQLICVHNMVTKTLDLANWPNQTFEKKDAYSNQAIKLMRLFMQQMATFKNYRQKSQQNVTVEHVNVHEGGQAIVGSVTKGEEK